MTKKMWGGRFKEQTDAEFWKFSNSLDYDKQLLEYDIKGSIAHVKMLSKCNIVPKKESGKIEKALSSMLKDAGQGKLKIDQKAEDIHTAVFIALQKRVGKAAEFLHTARSRNDQVVLDLKMYCRDKLAEINTLVKKLQTAMVDFSKKHVDVVMPGYTHTQHAVCILLSHQVLAYVNMLERDKQRLISALERIDEMPLGSCSMAGTGLTIDRQHVANLLGFSKISQNSIDAVSSRDFVLEILSALSILSMNLSRISQDLIFFSCNDTGFLDIAETYCTGSSIMPQKKNPDSLELIRATSAKLYSNLILVLTMMKGLPLSYNRDMQLDKEPLFSSVNDIFASVSILTGIFKTLKVNGEKIDAALAENDTIYALDIADYLVRKKMPFSEAHSMIGKIINYTEKKNTKLSALSIAEYKKFNRIFEEDIFKVFNAKRSVMLKKSMGSTNPLLVRQQIDKWYKKLKG